MNLKNLKRVYFLGIGGIGMSAIARYFIINNISVYGYDRVSTPLTQTLESEGIVIHYNEDSNMIPNNIDLVVYTPAIPETHGEWNQLRSLNVPIVKRAEVLGIISKNLKTIAIAGTHGKTTITSMVAHLLNVAGVSIAAFIGGIANNFNSNFVLHKDAEYMVVEADEYDRSFLHLHPNIAIINSIDADHLDVYGDKDELVDTFKSFASQIDEDGLLILKEGIVLKNGNRCVTFSSNPNSDLSVDNLRIEKGNFIFDLIIGVQRHKNISFSMPGRHNVENALAAVAVALELNIPIDKIIEGLKSYTGVKRRFDIRYKSEDLVYIDDYAHHPEELKACILAVKELYPGKRICGLFQPHLFSRTQDFAIEFAESLDLLDEVKLLEIYPARELPIEGVNSSMLISLMKNKNKEVIAKDEVINKFKSSEAQVFLTLGAGDIDFFVNPLEQLFNNKS